MKKLITTHLGIFVLLFLVGSCSKNDSNKNNQENTEGYDEYFIAMAGDEKINIGYKYSDTESVFSGSASYKGSACDHDFGSGIYPFYGGNLPTAGIVMVDYHQNLCGGTDENNVFNSLFPTGNYQLSDGNSKGMIIEFTPDSEDSNFYSSEFLSQPNSSYVRVTNSEENNIPLSLGYYNFGQLLTGEFSLKVQNVHDETDIMNVEGIFKLRIESYSEGRLE